MKDIAVMYHYVRNRDGWNGIHPLEPEKFKTQIEILSKYFEIVGPDDLDKKGSKPKCVLTFDDATKDQSTIAFDILKRKGLPAYFTVMSGPYVKGKIPVFHLVHTVLSTYSEEEIWTEINKEFDLKDIDKLSSTVYHYEVDLLRRYIKYTLNYVLSENQSLEFLENRVISNFGSKKNFIEQFYISNEEFIKMKEAGMTIGVHCVDHRPYSGNALHFYKNEIEPCANFIKENIGIDPKWYTPAFGGGEQYKTMIEKLEPILKDHGYKGGFLTISGLNNGLSKFWLKRFDCINLPPLSNLILTD
ncbi:polysaccharide deacetylase family protein [Bacillus sp. V5-8f]|uniref:polysaccharide deacetylase family protein n=1 Tax=Bacillus sp. V5-8f TaxID=2053044 RepID=UPI000C775BC3|nr:polysaccharide deacetylase family protein [Bacillus sp. V5-8f]PLT35492.1 polysaccharide deacetylase [Bacillus sp. V5-8f]